MKINNQSKTEAIAIIIILILFVAGLLLRAIGTSGLFVMILSSPLVALILVVLAIHWSYQTFRSPKTH